MISKLLRCSLNSTNQIITKVKKVISYINILQDVILQYILKYIVFFFCFFYRNCIFVFIQ